MKQVQSSLTKLRYAGFTLFEIMAVLSILIVLAGIAFPDFGKLYKTYKFNSYAYQIESLVKYAKMLATEKSSHISFCANTTHKIIALYNETISRNPDCSSQPISQINISDNWIDLKFTVSFNKKGEVFDPRGFSLYGSQICISNGDSYFKIITSINRSAIISKLGKGACSE